MTLMPMTLAEFTECRKLVQADLNTALNIWEEAHKEIQARLAELFKLDGAHPQVTFLVASETEEDYEHTLWSVQTPYGECRGAIMPMRRKDGEDQGNPDWWIGAADSNPVVIDFQGDDEGYEPDLRVHLVRVLRRMGLVA